MRKPLLGLLLALSTCCPASIAQPPSSQDGAAAGTGDTPAPLTPAILKQLLECRGSAADLFSYAGTLFSDQPPGWLKEIHANGHSGMMGLWTYQLAQPIDIFGHSIDKISFMNNWVVAELSRDAALSLVQQQHMERVPIHSTEQYFHFVDDEGGPMLGAFAPTDDALDMAFGATPKADEENKTLFVGCNYSVVSKTDFLDAAKHADGMLRKSANDLKHMLEKKP
jgi:hypothetical protein